MFLILWKTFHQALMQSSSFRLRSGLVLLIFNFPLGYGSLLVGSSLAAIRQERQWLLLGSAGYLLSWLMLAAGTWLLGKEMKNKLRHQVLRKKKAWIKLQQKQMTPKNSLPDAKKQMEPKDA